MATDYGTDVQALDDLPDPEVLVSGPLNVAYAMARRLCQDADVLEEIGDDEEFDSINLNDWMGGDYDINDPSTIDDIQQQVTQVLLKDVRVASVTVKATIVAGLLQVAAQGFGAAGPFGFVITIDGVSAPLIEVSS